MTKKQVKLKYWFYHYNEGGTVYEDEKGNWVIAFSGIIRIGEPFHIHDANGDEVDAEEIGLLDMLRGFIVPEYKT